MTFKDSMIVAGLGGLSIILGSLTVVAGFGFVHFPPSIPIFGPAAETVSPLYLAIGVFLIIIGVAAIFITATNTVRTIGMRRGRHGGR